MFSFASFLKKGGAGGGGAGGSRSNSVDDDGQRLLTDPTGSDVLGACNQRAGKVKSIYRRPSTSLPKNKATDGQCSIAEMKRIQFAQRMLWFSEPEDTLDVSEDERDNNGRCLLSSCPNSPELLDTPWRLRPPEERRPRAVSDSALPGSILKKPDDKSKQRPSSLRDVTDLGTTKEQTAAASVAKQKKQTNFKENVDVYYYDHKATPTTAATTTDSQKLKDHGLLHALDLIYDEISGGSPRLGRGLLDETYPRSGKSDQRRRSLLGDSSGSSFLESSRTDPKPTIIIGSKKPSSPTKTSIFLEKETEILPGPNENVEVLRLVIRLTDTARKLRTSVKAMSGGYCLLVSCARDPNSKSDSSRLHEEDEELTEKVNLPLRVNPYSVKAFIHKSGKLIIEAVVAWDGLL